jgi:hypothetical protein
MTLATCRAIARRPREFFLYLSRRKRALKEAGLEELPDYADTIERIERVRARMHRDLDREIMLEQGVH